MGTEGCGFIAEEVHVITEEDDSYGKVYDGKVDEAIVQGGIVLINVSVGTVTSAEELGTVTGTVDDTEDCLLDVDDDIIVDGGI